MKLPDSQCHNCPFLPDGLWLPPEKLAEIYEYLTNGMNHLCHGDRTNNTVCVGGRNWQLEMWCNMGWIDAPTNEALALAMRKTGVEPKEHIARGK